MRAVGSAHIKISNINDPNKMANTYHQIYIQTIFAVKYRGAVIGKEWQTKLFGDRKFNQRG